MFEAYSQLLTEMVLRLPYQIKKIADANPRIPPPVFDHSWFYYLSEVSHHINVFFLLSFQKREIDLLIFPPQFFPVSDDTTDTIRQEASQKTVVVHLRLKGKISSATRPAHS